jgi:dTDP-glucose 4,6-dehydratase
MKRVLLTGAGGFIGAHALAHFLTNTTWEIVATDSFRHKGKTDRLAQMLESAPHWRPRVQVITHDLAAPFSPQLAARIGHVDYVLAMASESHVDRSITDPVPFVRNNVDVVLSTLEFCRESHPEMVIVVSTDEVYGPVAEWNGQPPHREWAPILPSNPYAASKAAQEAIAVSYWRTYGVPVVITNTMNVIGEMQDREKYLPMLISRIAQGETVTVHGRKGVPFGIGSRHYLHARNAADAWLHIFRKLPAGQWPRSYEPDRYNVVGPDRVSNLELAERVAELIGRPLRYELADFHSARPGHDPHYGLDGSKLAAAGWSPPVDFAASLARTVRWTLDHPEWLA